MILKVRLIVELERVLWARLLSLHLSLDRRKERRCQSGNLSKKCTLERQLRGRAPLRNLKV